LDSLTSLLKGKEILKNDIFSFSFDEAYPKLVFGDTIKPVPLSFVDMVNSSNPTMWHIEIEKFLVGGNDLCPYFENYQIKCSAVIDSGSTFFGAPQAY
jgi:hypothetical protein